MRRIEPSARRRTSSSITTSGASRSNALHIFSRVTIFMKAQLLHPQVESTGGAGINRFCGFSRCIWYRIPASVTTMNVSAESVEAYFSRAAVLPM